VSHRRRLNLAVSEEGVLPLVVLMNHNQRHFHNIVKFINACNVPAPRFSSSSWAGLFLGFLGLVLLKLFLGLLLSFFGLAVEIGD
jgi:hypothetical protein